MFRKHIIILLVLLSSCGNRTFSQSDVFVDGEELYYEVYYSFINIGWAKFNTKKLDNDRYLCTAVLRSNDALPFVTVNFDFSSEIQILNDNIKPLRFESRETKEGKTSILTYQFNYEDKYVDVKKFGFDSQTEYEKRIPMFAPYQDGLSVFYYARYNYFKNQKADVPVLFNQDSTNMQIEFNTAKTEIDIGAIDYDISSLLLQGSTSYQLVFGLTGDFSGWFSDDGSRIPVKAKLKVKIGSITLELKSWKHGNWNPPKY